MSDFDEMIERYSRELINAKSRSILKAIEEDESAEEVLLEEDSVREPYVSVMNAVENDSEDIENALSEESQEEPAQENENGLSAEKRNASDDILLYDGRSETPDSDELQNESSVPFAPATGTGLLKVQVFAANQVYPISAAKVDVTDENGQKSYFNGYTNASGIVDNISLPAPLRETSETPSRVKPYAQYDITVEHPRFIKMRYKGVPVFAGVKSIQTVQLVPNGTANSTPEIVSESEPNALLLDKQEV